MKIPLILILLIIASGCATHNIKYDRDKIIKKYAKKYTIYVDNQKTDLNTTYLGRSNIKNVQKNRRTKELKISLFKKANYFNLKNFILDSLFPNDSIDAQRKIIMIIIDGVPILDNLKEKNKIDLNSIQRISRISQEKLSKTAVCQPPDGDILQITTK